jgi:hypothetical protein
MVLTGVSVFSYMLGRDAAERKAQATIAALRTANRKMASERKWFA